MMIAAKESAVPAGAISFYFPRPDMRALWSLMSLYRGDVRIVTFLAAIAGHYMSYHAISLMMFVEALFISLFLYNFVYVLNSISDIEEDRINKPKRALPSGDISLRTAWIYLAIIVAASVLCIPLLFTGLNLFFAYLVLFFGVIYSLKPVAIKNVPILASFITGWGMAHPLFITGSSGITVFAIAFIFCAAGVTLLKDLTDIEGDRLAGRRVITDYIPVRGIALLSAVSEFIALCILAAIGQLTIIIVPISLFCFIIYYLLFVKPQDYAVSIYKRLIATAVVSITASLIIIYFTG